MRERKIRVPYVGLGCSDCTIIDPTTNINNGEVEGRGISTEYR